MSAENDAFISGFHGIPSPEKLRKMSLVELAELLSSCQKDSPRFLVAEREFKNRLAKDQAKINLPNMLWAAALAGVFAIVGAVVGAIIRGLPPTSQIVATPVQPAMPPANTNPTTQTQVPNRNAQPSQDKP